MLECVVGGGVIVGGGVVVVVVIAVSTYGVRAAIPFLFNIFFVYVEYLK